MAVTLGLMLCTTIHAQPSAAGATGTRGVLINGSCYAGAINFLASSDTEAHTVVASLPGQTW